MKIITIDRAVVEQALEALEAGDWYINQLELIAYSVDDTGTHEERAKVQVAITALRVALAQERAEPVREPVALIHTWRKNGRPHAELLDWGVGVAALPDGKHTLYTAPPKAEQKPMHPELRKMWEEYFDKCFRAMPVPPPQREPLTREEIMDLCASQWAAHPVEVARLIERAHGIGGQE